MFHFIVLLLCYFLPIIFGKIIELPDGRIVGGESTTIEEFPYQVSLRYKGDHKCGGSIINKKCILTAAHCIDGENIDDIDISVGSTYKTKGGQVYSIKKIIKHENYNSENIDNDIAILILTKNLEFNDSIQSILLSNSSDIIEDGSKVIISGWGILKEDEFISPDILQFVQIDIINQNQCIEAYKRVHRNITENMICAGSIYGGRDACQQDSGGPLIFNNKQIGVISWGLGCGRIKYPGVYARVSSYRQWIDENINDI